MNGIGCDIVWSDPTDDDRGHVNGSWEFNQSRGCSYVYGYAAVREFLKVNKLACLIRAHEVQNDGYKCHVWGDEGFPQVLTIFSAPNYCGTYGNRAGVITLENGVLNIEQYNTSGSPFLLPDFKNSFSWSIPFITEKVCELFRNLVTLTDSGFHWELDAKEEEGFNKLFQTGELNRFLVGADRNFL
jgi:serine/threonine-protein phosphatase 2B catalytic subunit